MINLNPPLYSCCENQGFNFRFFVNKCLHKVKIEESFCSRFSWARRERFGARNFQTRFRVLQKQRGYSRVPRRIKEQCLLK
ncbi:hypothetical protein RIR_jg11654.t1 [Rhizophagus irregularis DAOM 181602=DAOM 197198]|nr:hypothetical protein RIR_jg11654.t1 [Rhizophagus irregularis DAOM 181602=DAOM 197198]